MTYEEYLDSVSEPITAPEYNEPCCYCNRSNCYGGCPQSKEPEVPMQCCKCGGEGFERSLDEEEVRRGIMDSCYHCAESGQCDCEPRELELRDVVSLIAQFETRDYIDYLNSTEEGAAFHAAEEMMTEHDFRKCKFWEFQERVATKLHDMPRDMQDTLILWSKELYSNPWPSTKLAAVAAPSTFILPPSIEEDDLPF